MKRGVGYRIIAITLAFLMLSAAILVPMGTNLKEPTALWIAGGVLSLAYIGALVWSLVDYGRKKKSEKERN